MIKYKWIDSNTAGKILIHENGRVIGRIYQGEIWGHPCYSVQTALGGGTSEIIGRFLFNNSLYKTAETLAKEFLERYVEGVIGTL